MSRSDKSRSASPNPQPNNAEPTNPFAEFFRKQMGHEAAEPDPPPSPATAPRAGLDRLLVGQTVTITIDRKRRRGKTVTIVSGIHLGPADMEELARRLRVSCGAGGTLDGSVIEVQGDHRERLSGYLSSLGVKVKG